MLGTSVDCCAVLVKQAGAVAPSSLARNTVLTLLFFTAQPGLETGLAQVFKEIHELCEGRSVPG